MRFSSSIRLTSATQRGFEEVTSLQPSDSVVHTSSCAERNNGLDAIWYHAYISDVEVVHTDEFGEWWDGLSEDEQEDVARVVELLRGAGVLLSFPHSSALKGTKQPLRELRARQGASPLRVVYAFDPKRDAVLLIGGDKGSDARFYERIIPRAERIWKEYLDEQAKGLHEEEP